ncbi:selenocysteine-specific translation elongation factor [Alkaliphilus metalliredigens QYMF]|uniref:Selenocysteine-specific elongation factor n=1 Tax=Alkaliphilus metalliredigens (strain QYMF) TaxID=293826 RepID=A6TQL3_ALKMQ|nr:selenocysteine-specific translation elongation factor [Alkaliphilus metalliredigens]ABR48481.1 selenocysteine-specific translation elongation factor [Alkaliphilus metalliredigens QYMF]
MENIVIGTAGHIDHGKTTLIKALTGRETDRLKEEKKRGISIELGFTYFDLPSGKRAGIIDVPGHEKFIRNMLAGVGGMDIVLLVVAADEGVMPQTKEHLDIISVLNIKKGIIVITKAGLVDEEWLELVKADIKERVKDTFLRDADMMAVDSVNQIGIKELVEKIDHLTNETGPRDTNSPARMPIDRVFTITGFGTVVTGTLGQGKITVEDTMEILPAKQKVRIRNIQVHGKSVKTAYAGQRVAINLANVKKEEIERGFILAQIDSLEATMMIDAKFNMLKDAQRIIKNRDRVRIYHGSAEVLARVSLLGTDELLPGESSFVQFRLEELTAIKKDDPLVIRLYSPMETLGGAIVIDGNPQKHKRFDQKVIEDLALREKGTLKEVIEKQVERYSNEYPDISFISKTMGLQLTEVKEQIQLLEQEDKVVFLGSGHVLHQKYFGDLKEKSLTLLSSYHEGNPLRKGMLKEELISRLFTTKFNKVADSFLQKLFEAGEIKIYQKYVAMSTFQVKFNEQHQKIRALLEKAYGEQFYNPPRLEDVTKQLPFDNEIINQVIEAIMDEVLIKISSDITLHMDAYKEAKNKLSDHIEKNGKITLSEFRDLLDTSRKFAVAILEHFDNHKITKRLGDTRVLM